LAVKINCPAPHSRKLERVQQYPHVPTMVAIRSCC
jgi:hypothetical protein